MLNTIYYRYYILWEILDRRGFPRSAFSSIQRAASFLGAIEGCVLCLLIQLVLGYLYCVFIDSSLWVVVIVITVFLNNLYYSKMDNARKVIKRKPLAYNNIQLTNMLAILFCALGLSYLFIFPVIEKEYLIKLCSSVYRI